MNTTKVEVIALHGYDEDDDDGDDLTISGVKLEVTHPNGEKEVTEGYFGGEPEDNCECRRYRWVIPMLRKAAEKARLQGSEEEAQKRDELLSICRKFIQSQSITCAETIYQTDRVSEHALPFIESVCKVVGYSKVKAR